MGDRRIIILMTGTIAPNGCPGAMFEPEERKRQYLKAFGFYVDKLLGNCAADGLIFCDNSDVPLDSFKVPEEVKGKVELVQVESRLFCSQKGKGYNEALLINKSLLKSKIIDGSDDPLIVKVTGRYSILNISRFIRYFRKHFEKINLHVDIKDHHLYSLMGLNWNEHYSDTRLLAFKLSFYKSYLMGREDEINDVAGVPLEAFFYKVYTEHINDLGMSFRHPWDLLIRGRNGHPRRFLSVKIPDNFEEVCGRCRWLLGTFIRIIFPWFWF